MSIIGKLQNVGQRLIGALANIGTTNGEILELDRKLGEVVKGHNYDKAVVDEMASEFKPNRAQRRRRNRFRCSRNVEFHGKRGNKADGKGALKQYASWTNEEANSRGMNIMYNPLASKIVAESRRQHEAKEGVKV